MDKLSHIAADGSLHMVDVGEKTDSSRVAIAETTVCLNAKTMQLLQAQALSKGDVLACAKVAGTLAAKKTSDLIPLCHPIALNYIDIRFFINAEDNSIRIEAECRCSGKTGVEMEALTAVQVAALTIYDMCKAVQKDILITSCSLLHKSGGKSGLYEKKA